MPSRHFGIVLEDDNTESTDEGYTTIKTKMDSRSDSAEDINNAREVAKRASITECKLLTLAGIGIAVSLSGIPFICSSGDQTSFAVGLTLFCLGLLILMTMCCQGMISSMRRSSNVSESDIEDDRESLTRIENTPLEIIHNDNAYVCVPTAAPIDGERNNDGVIVHIRNEENQPIQFTETEDEYAPCLGTNGINCGDYTRLTGLEEDKEELPTYDQIICSDV
ncbi:uncharacterized protein LOC144362830 [Saccoglossus kowalevskii]